MLLETELESIRTLEALEQLEPEWERLWRRASAATVFQSPAWLIPFARHFVAATQLRTFALRQHGRLVALFPFYILEEGDCKKLLFLGSGISDWLDALIEPGFRERAVGMLFGTLEAIRSEWDVCELQMLRAGSTLAQATLPSGWRQQRELQEVCPSLDLPADAPAIDHVIPGGFLTSLNRARRAARGQFEIAQTEAGDLESALNDLFALHGARWGQRGMPGVLESERIQRFHREVAAGLLELGVLRFYRGVVDGQVVATLYGFYHNREMSFYIAGFDPAIARLSPGSLLFCHGIEEAIANGARRVDFLRGNEPYKYRWGTVDRPAYVRRLTTD